MSEERMNQIAIFLAGISIGMTIINTIYALQ